MITPEGRRGGRGDRARCRRRDRRGEAGAPWPDFDAFGQPGAAGYGCVTFDLPAGETAEYPFLLRIDRVLAGAADSLTVKINEDPAPTNNEAAIVINGTGGGGGGDGGGPLPVTGPTAGLIAGLGALLVIGGVLVATAACRRGSRVVP